ncbi:MAG TPA: T9SS type A sorting domain-containing protein, partial [Prolixibacteraceae bacterium]
PAYLTGVTYNWAYSGEGATIVATRNSARVSYSDKATSGTLSVTATNSCGTSIPRSLEITVLRQAPRPEDFTISTSKVCRGTSDVVYEVPKLSEDNVLHFRSSPGIGWNFKRLTPNSVSINFSASAWSGYLIVSASSSDHCRSDKPRAIYVNVISEPPGQPDDFMNSSSLVCPGKSNVLYKVPYVSGVVYEWAYSGTGATINATKNYAFVNFSSTATSGTLSVTATNTCGTSVPRTVDITVNSPAVQPENFTTFTSNICRGTSNVVYEVPNVPGVQYIWTYSGTGATIVGRPSNSVLVSYSASATSGYMTVKAYNGCGSYSPMRSLYINVNDCTLKSGSLLDNGAKVTINATSATNELKVYPNPSSGVVYFDFQINENAKVTLDLSSMTGQQIAKIFDADVEAGITQTVIFDQSLAPGVYLYVMRWNNQVITGKLIITQ